MMHLYAPGGGGSYMPLCQGGVRHKGTRLRQPIRFYRFIQAVFLLTWFFILSSAGGLSAQKKPIPPGMGVPAPYVEAVSYIVHAPLMLPQFVTQRQWSNMTIYLTNWENAIAANAELIFAARALSAIETGQFATLRLPCDIIPYLSDYARELQQVSSGDSSFRYYVHFNYMNSYDATSDVRKYILFIQGWALRLLDGAGAAKMDSTQALVCGALAGRIPNPAGVYSGNKGSYPRIASIERNIAVYNDSYFRHKRDSPRGTAALLAGWWHPTGNLMAIGSHPFVGILLGYRTKLNEYDFACDIRFMFTPSPYLIARNDTLYSRNYYDGGYVGFDYTRYLVHKKYFEFGVTAGFGYDFFDLDSGSGDLGDGHSLSPVTIGSVNFNGGLRAKYFFRRRCFIGLVAKYDVINYCNTGGTDLAGNAWSLALIFGSH